MAEKSYKIGKVTSVTNVIGGGGGAEEAYISFINCDGTEVASWTKEELASATELPPLPTYDGLVCQGWNWTLEEMKEADCENIVGAVYTTPNGHNQLYVEFDEETNFSLSYRQDYPEKTSTTYYAYLTLDWGDGSDVITKKFQSSQYNMLIQNRILYHTYQPGKYIIDIDYTIDEGGERYIGLAFRFDKNYNFLTNTALEGSSASNIDIASCPNISLNNSIKRVHCTNIPFHTLGMRNAIITLSNDLYFYTPDNTSKIIFSQKTIIFPRIKRIKNDSPSLDYYIWDWNTEIVSWSGNLKKHFQNGVSTFSTSSNENQNTNLRKLNVQACAKYLDTYPPLYNSKAKYDNLDLSKNGIRNEPQYYSETMTGANIKNIKFRTGAKSNFKYYSMLNDSPVLETAEITAGEIVPSSTFKNCTGLKNVILSDSIKYLDSSCFKGTISLSEINLPEGLLEIAYESFSQTGLEKLKFPSTMTYIGNNCFKYSNIKEFDLYNVSSSIRIEDDTFSFIRPDAKILIDVDVLTSLMENKYNYWSKYIDYIDTNGTYMFPIGDVSVPESFETHQETGQHGQWAEIDIKTCNIKIEAYSISSNMGNTVNLHKISNDKYLINYPHGGTFPDTVTFNFTALDTRTGGYVELTQTINVDMKASGGGLPYPLEFEDLGTEYTFVPSEDGNWEGWYDPTNRGNDSSYSLAKINIYGSQQPGYLYMDWYQDSENGYDYGMFSELGNELGMDSEPSGNIAFNAQNQSGESTYEYGWIDYDTYIYVKYRKDGSGSNGEDIFRWRARWE